MPTFAKRPENKRSLVEPGIHRAKLIDIADKGQVPSQWGERPVLALTWEVVDSDGSSHEITQRLTNSLFPGKSASKTKAALRPSKLYEIATELSGRQDIGYDFDLDQLIGAQANVTVVHRAGKDRTFANIDKVVRPPKAGEAESQEGW